MGTVNVVLGEDARLNLILGQQLENAVTSVVFDFSAWQTTYGAGTLALSVQRPGDEMPYAVTLTTSGTNATWSVTNLDTAYKGVGHIQLTYTVGSAIKKSVVYKFTVYESLGANGEYPSPGQTWQEGIEDDIEGLRTDVDADHDELIDIREGADGVTYPSAGDAVRGQITDVKSDLNETNERFDSITDNIVQLKPDYILNDVIYNQGAGANGSIVPFSDAICYVYELEQLKYHIKVTNRTNVLFGLSNILYSDSALPVSVKIDANDTTEYDLSNNQNYKYLYITKKGQTVEYGIEITTPFTNKILGSELPVIEATEGYLKIIADNLSSYTEGYIISTTGAYYQWLSNNFYATDYLDVEGINNLILLMPVLTSLSTHAGAAFYDSEKTYISGVECSLGSVGGNETRIINVPSNAKYIRTTCRANAWNDFFIKKDDILIMRNSISNLENISEHSYGMQLFEKIGVIGDSISCGWAKDKNGNNSRRNLGISWPQQMARRLGCTAYNLGASGVDPVEWFQPNYEFAQYCYTQYQSVGMCDMYIVGLGLNPTSTLGSISDINSSDYTQNAETFFGQYARIIQMINAEHPDAIVICVTEPTTRIASTDQAVRDICALSFINANLVDLEKDYFDLFNTEEIISERQPDGLHYTPYGYSLLADAIETALNDYIAKHTTSFKYVGVASVDL